MVEFRCPLCKSLEIETDEEGIITVCENCGNSEGYTPLEIYDENEEAYYFCCSEDEHNYLKDLEFMEGD